MIWAKALNRKPSPNPLYQQWIETYITDELEQQIKEEEARSISSIVKATRQTNKNARGLPPKCPHGS